MTTQLRATPERADATTGGLDVRGLSAGYGEVLVIDSLDLHVDAGEIVAMLGRNGAGKTTTLMAIGGFLRRVSGEVRVGGVAVTGAPYRRMRGRIGLVLEGRTIFGPMTTVQNLKVGNVAVAEAVELFPELEPRLNIKAGLLSGGEQQMLSLARAMLRRPDVLLLDELSFGLAPVICDRLFSRIRRFAEDHGMAVLLVEQHLHYAAMVADRVLVMNEGRIVVQLPANELERRADEIERLYLGGPESATSDGDAKP
jgi:branched-chain amino acid transport system ATP-binding protein